MQVDDTFQIELKKKANWPLTFFLGFWLLIWVSITGTILYGLITTPERIDDLVIIVLIAIIIGLWVIDIFCWQISGVEALIISNEIEIIKRGKLFRSSRTITFDEYESVSWDEDLTPFWIRLFGLGGGKVIIRYLGRQVRFGQNVSFSYAEIIANEIDKEIQKRNHSL